MTNKQIIECKYKFQSIEKFAGKPYCVLHNETCEFINFACDKNCQVYEDYKQLKAKEQECEELNNIINEAKNSKLDLKSFLVGEAIQNEYEQQLDQLKATNEDLLSIQYKLADNNKRLRQTLTEIKEIAEETSQAKFRNNACIGCAFLNDKILNKISECEVEE